MTTASKKKISKKKTSIKKTVAKKPAKKKTAKEKTLKKAAPQKGAAPKSKKTAKTEGRSAAALRLIDSKLAEFTPALKQKLNEVQTQIQTGDLRSLGLKVLERAKEISGKIKETAAPPARGSKKK